MALVWRALWLQNWRTTSTDTGTDPGYTAAEDRSLMQMLFDRDGVVEGFAVSERGAGANMTVDLHAGSGVVNNTDGPLVQGRYAVEGTGAVPDELAISAAPVSGTRIDIVVVWVNDSVTGRVGDSVEGHVVEGVVDAGDPAIPATAIPVARVTVASGTAAITDAMIDDLRGDFIGARLGIESVEFVNLANAVYSQSAIPDVLARRDSSGSVQVPTPTIAAQAVRKDYSDAGDAAVEAHADAGDAANTAHTNSFFPVSNANFRNSGASSVVGRASSTSVGSVADIGPAGPGDVLRRTNVAGSPITWGKVQQGNIDTNAVGDNEFRTAGPVSVVGRRFAGSTGNVADIGPASTFDVLRRLGAGTELTFGKLRGSHLEANTITSNELATDAVQPVNVDMIQDSLGGNVHYEYGGGWCTVYSPGYDGSFLEQLPTPARPVLRDRRGAGITSGGAAAEVEVNSTTGSVNAGPTTTRFSITFATRT